MSKNGFHNRVQNNLTRHKYHFPRPTAQKPFDIAQKQKDRCSHGMIYPPPKKKTLWRFDMGRAIGRDCAGAVSRYHHGSCPPRPDEYAHENLTEEEILGKIQDLKSNPPFGCRKTAPLPGRAKPFDHSPIGRHHPCPPWHKSWWAWKAAGRGLRRLTPSFLLRKPWDGGPSPSQKFLKRLAPTHLNC